MGVVVVWERCLARREHAVQSTGAQVDGKVTTRNLWICAGRPNDKNTDQRTRERPTMCSIERRPSRTRVRQ
jgi:hypothetical protein